MQNLNRTSREVGSGVQSESLHFFSSHRSNTPEIAHRQFAYEFHRKVGVDGEKAVGLAVVRGNLGKEFIVGHSGRCCQSQRVSDFSLDFLGDCHGERNPGLVFGHVKKGLIKGYGLDNIRVFMENIVHGS